jgi:hypothetical protein
MAASNSVFRIAELDFDTIKGNLKDYLRSQNQFTDYDFEGSGLNILLDVLAYNTHYMAYYLNMVGNEMFLDSALLRNSVVSHAKHLNYVPTSMVGSRAEVNIVVEDTTPTSGYSTITLPAYSQFESEQIDGTNYTFVNLETYSASKNVTSNTYTFSNVWITQGENISYNVGVDATNTRRRFEIPEANIDTSTLLVTVQNSDTDSTKSTYILADDVTTLDSNSKVYFLEESNANRYTLYFGDGYIGKNLDDGNIVQLKYLSTSGDVSNKANSFTLTTSILNFSNVVVNSISAAAGGAQRDTIDRIKFLAPKFYTAQNRAVTKDDYGTLLLKDYPNIETISVWGGEENDPVVYGKIFISMKPKSGYVITDIEKDRIINELVANRNVLTVIPEIVDPEYLYLKFDITVNYDSTLTTTDEAGLIQIIKNTITNYNASELEQFNSTFRTSKLQNLIDISDNSFLGSDLVTVAQKRFQPTLNESKNYTIDFNLPLNRGTFKDKLYSYPSFQILDNQGISRDALIEETPLSYTGLDSIEVLSSGSGYSDSPTVTVTGDGTGATARATVVNGKIVSIQVLNTGSDYTAAVVSISDSTGTGATASAVLSGQVGTLRTYYVQTTTGEKIIINSDAGRINYSTGRINLYNFKPLSISSNPNYASGVLTINAIPSEKTIHPLRNRLLSIDSQDPIAIQVSMENEA